METETPTTYNVRTGAGTVHTLTAGRTYKVRGEAITNRPDSRVGKADCGATTSSAACLTSEPANCAKCAATNR